MIRKTYEVSIFEIQRYEDLLAQQYVKDCQEDLLKSTRRNVYTVIFSGKTGAQHYVDNKLVKIPPYSVMFIGPERLSHYAEVAEPGTHVLVFSSLFFNRSSKDAINLLTSPIFNTFGPVYILTPPEETVFYCKTLTHLLYNASENFENKLNQDLAHNIIQQILIMGALYSYNSAEDFGETFESNLVLQFKTALSEHFLQEKTVKFYAAYLNVSERRLNKATNIILGLKAKDVITNHIMEEAKWRLIYTEESIKEISVYLGFSEEHNFSAFFKKNTKISPKTFRRRHQSL